LLFVPSAIVPRTRNCLLNPLHGDAARPRIVSAVRYPFSTHGSSDSAVVKSGAEQEGEPSVPSPHRRTLAQAKRRSIPGT